MLTKRVIPCMDVKDGRVVKGVNFVNLRDAGDPIELAQRYDEQKADEVIFLDITATSDGRATTIDMASRASEELHLPSSPQLPQRSARRRSCARSMRNKSRAILTNGKSMLREDARTRASMRSSGQPKLPSVALAKSCSPVWIAMAARMALTWRSRARLRALYLFPLLPQAV